jgi:hypothetical protein
MPEPALFSFVNAAVMVAAAGVVPDAEPGETTAGWLDEQVWPGVQMTSEYGLFEAAAPAADANANASEHMKPAENTSVQTLAR